MNDLDQPTGKLGSTWRRGLALPLSIGLGLLPILALVLLLGPGVASASPSASGVVTNCTNAGLTTALAGGGMVSFNCGPGPVTITVTSQKIITQPTSVDGGTLGRVILSGGNITRVFSVKSGASLTLNNLVIRNGYEAGGDGGGAVYVDRARLTVTNSSLISNTSTCCGGALYLGSVSTATIAGSTLANNQGTVDAGAIYNDTNSTLSIADSTIHDNHSGYAGAIENYGPLTLARVSLYGNLGTAYAGAIYNDGPAALVDVALFSNTVMGPLGWGGAMDDEYPGSVNLNRVQIYSNTVVFGHPNYGGGGLTVFYGALTLTDSSVYSNVANFGPGGGIHASYGATLTVVSSAIYGNRALAAAGGGIDLRSTEGGPPNLTLYNSTVSGNSSTSGGGLSTDDQEEVVISYSTVYSNSAPAGKNITGSIELASSIIAGSGNANCVGSTKSFGHNLEDGNSCGLLAPTDITDTNPLLGPLAFNGGPTPTHALLAGSPAIDAGDPLNCPATDQRGTHRPLDGDHIAGAVCDIGAFEYNPLRYLFLPLLRR